MGALKLIIPFLKKYKMYLFLYLIFILLSYPLESIAVPQLFSNLFDTIKGPNNSQEIFINFFKKFILLSSIIGIAQYATSLFDNFLIPEFNENISNLFYEKILKYYENNYTDLELGKILTRINSLPSILREITNDLFNWVIPKLFTVIIINIYFFTLDKTLGIASLITLILITLYNINSYQPCIVDSHNRYMEFENKSEIIQDKLSNLYSIYSAGNVDNELADFSKISYNFKKVHKKSMKCNLNIKNFNNFFCSILILCFCYYFIYLYSNNKIKKEVLLSLFMTLLFYMPCLNSIITYLPDYINHLGMLSSVNDFIDTIYIENNNKPNINITNGEIVINNLTFGYTKDNYLFNNFSLKINTKEKVGIFGPSGNGKSTLIKLIMGYYPVPDNTIFIDGYDINSYNLTSLRKQIVYINQNTKLFNDTIYNNIKYGNDVDNNDIMKVYDNFNLKRVFGNLPNGFNTGVGVNGESLSGGQKQIILLLRNFFKQNKIIVLDEPTSALDNDTRLIVLQIIKEMSINSTLIIITHDMKNLELVNRKINILNGKIVS